MRKQPTPTAQQIQQYLHWRQQEIDAKKNKEKFRKAGALDDLVTTTGDEQTDGSFRYYLDTAIPTEKGTSIVALEKRRAVQVFMDEDAAEKLAIDLDIVEEVSHMERVFDEDSFYALNQQGVISDDELDSLLVTTESFSLQVVTDESSG